MQLVDLAVDDQCVARVMAALKTRDDIGPFAEPIDDLAFSLVTPLGAHDDNICHGDPFRTSIFCKTGSPIPGLTGQ